MIQFYTPDLPDCREMPEGEASHCLRVLRMKDGDTVTCVDGRGQRYQCRLTGCTPKRAYLDILSVEAVDLPWNTPIAVAVAPTKHLDRMEWMVEKLVETGIDRIIPLKCDRSERKEIKTERLEKIAVSAMKQSLKAVMPVISPMTRLRDLVAEFDVNSGWERYMAYCDPEIPRQLFASVFTPGRPVLMLIGPEGDFSPGEIRMTLGAGFSPVSLGEIRLRTETAALFAVMAARAIETRLT